MSLRELERRRRRRRREGEEVSNNGGQLERRTNLLSLEGAEQQQPGHFLFRSEEEYLIVRTSLRWLSSKRKHRNGRNRAIAGKKKKKGNRQTIIMKKPKKKTEEGIFQTCLAHFHYFQKKRFRVIYGINNPWIRNFRRHITCCKYLGNWRWCLKSRCLKFIFPSIWQSDSKLSTTHHMLQIPWQLTMMSKVEMP